MDNAIVNNATTRKKIIGLKHVAEFCLKRDKSNVYAMVPVTWEDVEALEDAYTFLKAMAYNTEEVDGE